MKIFLYLCAFIGLLLPHTAYAQQSLEPTRQAIIEALQGQCSDNLSPVVKYQCEQTIGNFKERFALLGALQSLDYLGVEHTPTGPADSYVAKHENGEMLWLSRLGPDGKLNLFWSPG